MRKAVMVSLLSFSAAGHTSDISTYIVNGSDANVGDFPSFASLFYEDDRQYSTRSFCGATIINDYYVLTAAHCVTADSSQLPHITVAASLQNENNYAPLTYPRVIEYYIPNGFENERDILWPDDIAILKLDRSIGSGDLYSSLNFSKDRGFSGTDRFIAVGHGKNDYLEAPAANSPNLQEVELTYIDNATCIAALGTNISDKQICFDGADDGADKDSICSGDSGGPVYYQENGTGPRIQVGVASFGFERCGDRTKAVTSVFTDVYDYKSWIDNVITGNVSPTYYIQVQNGQRVLVDPSSPTAISPTSSDSSGGNVSVISLLGLLFISLMRHCRRVHMSCSSNYLRSQN